MLARYVDVNACVHADARPREDKSALSETPSDAIFKAEQASASRFTGRSAGADACHGKVGASTRIV